MSELSQSSGSEGYGTCDDAVDVGDDGYVAQFLVLHSKKPSRSKTGTLFFDKQILYSAFSHIATTRAKKTGVFSHFLPLSLTAPPKLSRIEGRFPTSPHLPQ